MADQIRKGLDNGAHRHGQHDQIRLMECGFYIDRTAIDRPPFLCTVQNIPRHIHSHHFPHSIRLAERESERPTQKAETYDRDARNRQIIHTLG